MSAKLLIKSARTKFCCYKREPNCSPSSFHSIDPPTFHAAIFSFQRIDPVEVILMKSEVKSHRSNIWKAISPSPIVRSPRKMFMICAWPTAVSDRISKTRQKIINIFLDMGSIWYFGNWNKENVEDPRSEKSFERMIARFTLLKMEL